MWAECPLLKKSALFLLEQMTPAEVAHELEDSIPTGITIKAFTEAVTNLQKLYLTPGTEGANE